MDIDIFSERNCIISVMLRTALCAVQIPLQQPRRRDRSPGLYPMPASRISAYWRGVFYNRFTPSKSPQYPSQSFSPSPSGKRCALVLHRNRSIANDPYPRDSISPVPHNIICIFIMSIPHLSRTYALTVNNSPPPAPLCWKYFSSALPHRKVHWKWRLPQ